MGCLSVLSIHKLYLTAFPPGLWLYHVRLGSTLPLGPHLLQSQYQGLSGSAGGRDIQGRGVPSSRRWLGDLGRRDLGKFVLIHAKYYIGMGHTIESIETKLNSVELHRSTRTN